MDSIKNKQKCQQNCTDHLFELRNELGYNKYDVTLSFCPKFRRDPYPPQKTIPQFNLDRKYYTSAFVLGTEKRSIINNAHQQLVHFNTQIRQAQQKNNQIFFPKPNQKNSYCSVCKQHYVNYYEHIHCDEHHEKIDAAIYNTEVRRLCENFRDVWNGAHERADKQIMEEYLRSQKNEDSSINKGSDELEESQEENKSGFPNGRCNDNNNKVIDKRQKKSEDEEQQDEDDQDDEDNEEDIFNINEDILQKLPKIRNKQVNLPQKNSISSKQSKEIKPVTQSKQIREAKQVKQVKQFKQKQKEKEKMEPLRKKKQKDESYQNQFIEATLRNGVPQKQIRTRSALANQKQKKQPSKNSEGAANIQIKEPTIVNQNQSIAFNKTQSQPNPIIHNTSQNYQDNASSHPPQLNRNSSSKAQIINKMQKSDLIVLLRKNIHGKYEIVKEESKNQNVSLQLKIRKDTRQIVHGNEPQNVVENIFKNNQNVYKNVVHKRQIYRPVKNPNFMGNNEEVMNEKDQSLCDSLKNNFANKNMRVGQMPINNQKPSSSRSGTPERLQPTNMTFDNRQFSTPQYPYHPYYAYTRMHPPMQGRMPIPPYGAPIGSTPPKEGSKGGSEEGQSTANNKQPYYPYPFPYGQNSWMPYTMHPGMMQPREQQKNSGENNSQPETQNPSQLKPVYNGYPQYNQQGLSGVQPMGSNNHPGGQYNPYVNYQNQHPQSHNSQNQHSQSHNPQINPSQGQHPQNQGHPPQYNNRNVNNQYMMGYPNMMGNMNRYMGYPPYMQKPPVDNKPLQSHDPKMKDDSQ